jgi:hypothetical protein
MVSPLSPSGVLRRETRPYEIGEGLRRTMTDSDLVHFEKAGGRYPVFPEEKRRKLTAISARVGVWGAPS